MVKGDAHGDEGPYDCTHERQGVGTIVKYRRVVFARMSRNSLEDRTQQRKLTSASADYRLGHRLHRAAISFPHTTVVDGPFTLIADRSLT